MKRGVSAAVLVLMIFVLYFLSIQIENNDAEHTDYVQNSSDLKTELSDEVKQTITSVYGIPDSVLETMPADLCSSLAADIDKVVGVSSSEAYFEIIYDIFGAGTVREATYQDYLNSAKRSGVNGNDWIKIHTAIIDMDSYAQIAAAYTWLTGPARRMEDMIGLAIGCGVVIDNSADGFYTYTGESGPVYTDFCDTPSAFNYSGRGIFCKVLLKEAPDPAAGEFLFIRGSIYKDSDSEKLSGVYAHQRTRVRTDSVVGLDSTGLFYGDNFTSPKYYDQFNRYTSIVW